MEKSQGGEVRSLDVTQSTVLKSKVPLLRPGASEQLPSQASLWVQFSCTAIVLGVYFSNKQTTIEIYYTSTSKAKAICFTF